VPVDLFGLSVAPKQTTQNSHALHPEELLGHTGVLGTLPLTVAGVTALPSGFRILANAGSGVNSDRLLDDETVADELADVLVETLSYFFFSWSLTLLLERKGAVPERCIQDPII
jgi:hypothetical protein